MREQPNSGRSAPKSIALLLIPILSIFALWRQQSQVPSRDDWRGVVEEISDALQPGDRISWYPEWAGEGRLFFHGLPVDPLPYKGPVDLGHGERLWLIGAFGYDFERLQSEHPLAGPHALLERRERGALTLELIEVREPRVIASLRDALADVEVSRTPLRGSAEQQRCTFWDGRGWHCRLRRSPAATNQCLARPLRLKHRRRARGRHLYQLRKRRHLPYVDCGLHPTEHVSQDIRIIGGDPRRCVWLSPHRGHRLQLRWTLPSSTPPGSQLVADYGWTDLSVRPPFSRRSEAKAVRLELSTEGTSTGTGTGTGAAQSLPPFQWAPELGWRREARPLAPGTRSVTLALSAARDDTRDGELCVSLTVRAPAASPLSPSPSRPPATAP